MTRPIVILMLAIVLSTPASCGRDPQGSTVADSQAEEWVEAPMIDRATRDAAGLQVSGQASPGSRIVIRGDTRTAFAVGTGSDGRFDLRVPAPERDSLYVVEIQTGEHAVPAATRLLVAGDPSGPVALISPGSPSKRLDPGTGLDVVDSDGRTRIASGRAVAGKKVAISVDGGEARIVTASPAGRWTLNLGAIRAPSATITVDGTSHVFPGEGGTDAPIDRLVRSGDGMALRWKLSDTAQQSSWFTISSPGPSARPSR
ncbi:hypothetical protein [Brevundimonas variabilis]|uniref:Bacterial Ig domain-containing protein n=1 Tax=Brevundimonas variabilis TaxID=74312 RepID=A0A7W9CI65_9CAUL|nr:hypothetical protein [Brevundimonas variabilis]MBB5746093.1 hypothetical protein [Brevundimonas variabilis]